MLLRWKVDFSHEKQIKSLPASKSVAMLTLAIETSKAISSIQLNEFSKFTQEMKQKTFIYNAKDVN